MTIGYSELNDGFPTRGWTGRVCGLVSYPSATAAGPGVVLVPDV